MTDRNSKTITIANHIHLLALTGFTEEALNEAALLNDAFTSLDEFIDEYSVLGDDIVTRLTTTNKEDTMSEETETKEETKTETKKASKTLAVRLVQVGLPTITLSKETLESTGLKGDASLVKDELYELDYFTFATKASKILRDMVTDELGRRIEAAVQRLEAKIAKSQAPAVPALIRPQGTREEAIGLLVSRLVTKEEGRVAEEVLVDLLQHPISAATASTVKAAVQGHTLYINVPPGKTAADNKRRDRLIGAFHKACHNSALRTLAIENNQLPIGLR